MRTLTRVVLVVSVAAFAATASASISAHFVDWGKGPAQWLMTKDEQAQWKKISDDAAAQAFVDLFWVRRDPTPGTPANEFKDDFDARVAAAEKQFPEGHTKGSMTDRGHVFIMLGRPTRIERTGAEPKSTILTPSSAPPSLEDKNVESLQAYSPKQLWTYDAGKTKLPPGAPPFAEFAFVDQYGSNEWKLERTGKTDVADIFNKAINASIVQPGLTEVPKPAAPSNAPVVAPAATAVAAALPAPALEFKNEALRAAVDELKAGKTSYKNLFVSYGEFITPQGDYFVPVQLYVPKVAGLSATQDLTFFGMVEDEAGKTAAVFEEPAKLVASKNDYYVDKSIKLAPGKYKGTFGLAENGKPLSMVRQDLDLAALDKDAPAVSRMILSNNVYTLAEAQKPTDPFAFGGLKVVPKSDHVFSPSEELWYFFEARNPALDPTTKLPKLRENVQLTGTSTDGKKIRMELPSYDADAMELKGMPGHFAVGTSIPLDTFKAGDYTLTVKLVDTISSKTYELKEAFKIRSEK